MSVTVLSNSLIFEALPFIEDTSIVDILIFNDPQLPEVFVIKSLYFLKNYDKFQA